MRAWGKTDIGKAREVNQDAYIIENDVERSLAMLVVCDGMGGARAGDIAANIAAGAFAGEVWEHLEQNMQADAIRELVSNAARIANNEVNNRAQSDPACNGMGTTLVAAVVSGMNAVIINIGDSRAYRIGDSTVEKLTRDHSVVEDMMLQGDISREEARTHPSKNLITRAIGGDNEVVGDIYDVKFEDGDCLLLCSDGLSNPVEEQELLYESKHGGGIETACDRLVDLANARGGRDNITVAILEFREVEA